MSTRSLTIFVNNEFDENKAVCAMYRQSDGYLSGHGAELKEFLSGFTIVNGIGGETPKKAANGAGCLAAQTIAYFKDGIGRIYVHSLPDSPDGYEAYNYIITAKSKQPLHLKVRYYDKKTLYDGPLDGFDPEMEESDDDE